MDTENYTLREIGEYEMPQKDIPSIILELKAAKKEKEITYPRLLDMLEANKTPLGLTTLRRVFADGSEKNDSFNYASTIAPLEAILLSSDEIPEPETNPYAKELEGYKAVIHSQNEELVRLYQLIDHLEKRVEFLVEQIKHKDDLVNKLMEKVL